MRVTQLSSALGAAVISGHLLAATLPAQDYTGRAPGIRLTSPMGTSVISNYIEPAVYLSEDAYVFAISVDVDRNVQVLHPEFPGLSVMMRSERQLHLPRFFAGFREPQQRLGNRGGGYAFSHNDVYDPGFSDTRGTVIALASRAPFNLSLVTSDGYWDLGALTRLVDGRDPLLAASALARYLGAKGEPIGRDVLRFAGSSHSYASSYYGCYPGYGWGYAGAFGGGPGISYFEVARYRQAGFLVQFIGVDACGQPRFAAYLPRRVARNPGRRPAAKGVFPPSRHRVELPANPATKANSDRLTERNAQRRTWDTGRYLPNTSAKARSADPRYAPDRTRSRPATGAFQRPQPSSARAHFPERIAAPAPTRRPERIAPPPPAAVQRPQPQPPPAPRSEPRPARGKPVDN